MITIIVSNEIVHWVEWTVLWSRQTSHEQMSSSSSSSSSQQKQEQNEKKKKTHFCCLRYILYKYETTKPCYIRCNGTSSGNVLRWCSCREKKIARNNRLLSTFRASSSLHRNISSFLKRNCYLDKRRAFAEFNVVPVNFFSNCTIIKSTISHEIIWWSKSYWIVLEIATIISLLLIIHNKWNDIIKAKRPAIKWHRAYKD